MKIVFYFWFSRIIYIFICIAAWVYVAKVQCLDDYFKEDEQKSESKSPSNHHCSSWRGNSFVLKSTLTLWSALIHIFFRFVTIAEYLDPLWKFFSNLRSVEAPTRHWKIVRIRPTAGPRNTDKLSLVSKAFLTRN